VAFRLECFDPIDIAVTTLFNALPSDQLATLVVTSPYRAFPAHRSAPLAASCKHADLNMDITPRAVLDLASGGPFPGLRRWPGLRPATPVHLDGLSICG
jgi:hypothetical protein